MASPFVDPNEPAKPTLPAPRTDEKPADWQPGSYLEAAKELHKQYQADFPIAYDAETNQPTKLAGTALAEAMLQGKASFNADANVPMINLDGKYVDVPGANVAKAISLGFQLDNPTQMAARQFVQDYPTWSKFAAGIHAGSEGFGGLPEAIAKGAIPELDDPIVAAINQQAVHQNKGIAKVSEFVAEALPWATGLGEVGGLAKGAEALVTGEKLLAAGAKELATASPGMPRGLLAGARSLEKAGLEGLATEFVGATEARIAGAEAKAIASEFPAIGEALATKEPGALAALEQADKAALEMADVYSQSGVGRQILGRAANYGVQGALASSPKATGQLFNGDPETAAETLLWGAGSGALFGAASGLLEAGAAKAADFVGSKLGQVSLRTLDKVEQAVIKAEEASGKPLVEGMSRNEVIEAAEKFARKEMLTAAEKKAVDELHNLVGNDLAEAAAKRGSAAVLGAIIGGTGGGVLGGIKGAALAKGAEKVAEIATNPVARWRAAEQGLKLLNLATDKWASLEGASIARRWLYDSSAEPVFAQAMAQQGSSVFGQALAKVPGALAAMGEGFGKSAAVNAPEKFFTENALKKMKEQQAKTHEEALAQFKKDAERLNRLVSDPNHLADHVAGVSDVLDRDGHGSTIARALQTKMIGATEYLHSTMPKPPPPTAFANTPEWQPTPQQLIEWNARKEVVNNPLIVFQKLQEGTLLKAHTDAMQKVYPAMFRSLQKAVIETSGKKNAPRLPYPARVKLSSVLGIPLDPSLEPKRFAELQGSFADGQKPGNDKSPPSEPGGAGGGEFPSTGSNLRMANLPDPGTTAQRISQKGSQPPSMRKA